LPNGNKEENETKKKRGKCRIPVLLVGKITIWRAGRLREIIVWSEGKGMGKVRTVNSSVSMELAGDVVRRY
jgi:hypothetical protein